MTNAEKFKEVFGKELTEGLFFCKECEEKANSRK